MVTHNTADFKNTPGLRLDTGPTETSPSAGFRLQATGESFGAGPKKLRKVSPGEIAIVSGGLVAANAPEGAE